MIDIQCAEDSSVSHLAWAIITKDTCWADQITESYFLTVLELNVYDADPTVGYSAYNDPLS